MHIESDFEFGSSRPKVWEALLSPEVLAKTLPGTETLEREGDDEYVGVMRAGVGPVTAARFDVRVRLEDKVPQESFTMLVEGRGTVGFVEGAARIRLSDAGPEATLMAYTAELNIGGRIAAVGQRLLDSVGKAMAKQALQRIDRHIHELEEAGEPGGAVPERETPADGAEEDGG